MPHVIVKMYPGRTEEQKTLLTERIAREVVAVTGCPPEAVSVAIEEIAPDDWPQKVYRPDIIEKAATLTRKPGYKNPFS